MDSAREIIRELEDCLYAPYVYGGNNPLQGMDCSGLVCWILKRFNLLKKEEDLSAAQLYNRFSKSSETIKNPKAGALLFFGKREITHVAIAITLTRMIEAGGGDQTTKNRAIATAQGAMVRRQMIAARSDLYAILMPNWPEALD